MPTRTLSPYKLRFRELNGFNWISLYLLVFTSLSATRLCPGETLRDLLLLYKVPSMSYTERQLSASVQGTGLATDRGALILYSQLNGDLFVGPVQAIEYDFARKAMRASRLSFEQGDVCMGSPEEVYLIDGYRLFSTHISPSAECLVLLDEKLRIRYQFYGFSPVRIAPGYIAITEDMVHFAAVHPERMEVIDLRTSATVEIYPPANDPLRRQLSLEQEKKMPSSDICKRMNDPCTAALFDEDFYPVGSDGRGRLAFVASQSASHIFAENSEPQTVAEQSVFYSYAFQEGHWYYCEERIPTAAVDTLRSDLKNHFIAEASRHCKPDQQVSPDMSTATFNPLRNR